MTDLLEGPSHLKGRAGTMADEHQSVMDAAAMCELPSRIRAPWLYPRGAPAEGAVVSEMAPLSAAEQGRCACNCGRTITQGMIGRTREYATPACRQRAYTARKAGQAAG
jgi:hypothetical protein